MEIKKIKSSLGFYLAGFTDGKGSFNISFRKRNDYLIPWKISLCFNVSQKDRGVILALFKKTLQCGSIRDRGDGIWYYQVDNFSSILSNIIPFFDTYKFLSEKKKNDFSKFKKIALLIKDGQHLKKEGISDILKIRDRMNCGGKRKYSNDFIISTIEKSSETIRQASEVE